MVACLATRGGRRRVIFSKQISELLFGIRRCLWLSAPPPPATRTSYELTLVATELVTS